MEKRKKIFYGWWIVAGCFSLSFASIGIAMNSISILFRPVSDALGFSRGDFTLSFTVGAVAIMFSAPFIGRLYEKYDARPVVGASAVLLAGSFALFSVCRTLRSFTRFHPHGCRCCVDRAHRRSCARHQLVCGTQGTRHGDSPFGKRLGGLVFNPLGDRVLALYGWPAT